MGRPVRKSAARAASPGSDRPGRSRADLYPALRRLWNAAPRRTHSHHRSRRAARRTRRSDAARHDHQRFQRGRIHRSVWCRRAKRSDHGRQPQLSAPESEEPAPRGRSRRHPPVPPRVNDRHRGRTRPAPSRPGPRRRQRCPKAARHGNCRWSDYCDAAYAPRRTGHVPLARNPRGASASPGACRLGERLMIRSRQIAVSFLTFLLSANFAAAQSPSQNPETPATPAASTAPEDQRPHIAFNAYVTEVLRANLDLSVQRANIAISKAGVTTASVTPDWSVDVGLPTVDLANQGNPTNFS